MPQATHFYRSTITYNKVLHIKIIITTKTYGNRSCTKNRQYLIEDEDATVKPGGRRATSQDDFNENLAVKYYGITNNIIRIDALWWRIHTLWLRAVKFFHYIFLLYSQFVIQPYLARHPKNSSFLKNGKMAAQQNFDEYKMHNALRRKGFSFILHKVHYIVSVIATPHESRHCPQPHGHGRFCDNFVWVASRSHHIVNKSFAIDLFLSSTKSTNQSALCWDCIDTGCLKYPLKYCTFLFTMTTIQTHTTSVAFDDRISYWMHRGHAHGPSRSSSYRTPNRMLVCAGVKVFDVMYADVIFTEAWE